MRHWWNRSKRVQKHIRRWAQEPLITNLQRKAQAVLERDRAEQQARRTARTCPTCLGRRFGYMVQQDPDGPGKLYTRVACPDCATGG